MARNKRRGDGRRAGEVKGRSQVYSSQNHRWTKINTKSGRFMDQKAEKYRPFKGVKKK